MIETSSSIAGFRIVAGQALDPTNASSAGYIGNTPVDAALNVNGLAINSKNNTFDKSVAGYP